MPVSGLVLTLKSDPEIVRATLDWLGGLEAVALGEISGSKLPITLDTASQQEDKAYWHDLQDCPGILNVDVACVFFEDDNPDNASSNSAQPRPEARHVST